MIAPKNGSLYVVPSAWLSDYDDTEFLTGAEAPASGVTVNVAYKMALSEQVSQEAANRFEEAGGHLGRNAAQIVADSAPDMTPEEVEVYQKRVIGHKLGVLIEQIGTPLEDGTAWPRPTPGFLGFTSDIEMERARGDRVLLTGMVSAGHQEFIEATHALWGVSPPDVLITDDIVQERGIGLSPEERSKPSAFLMQLAQQEWKAKTGIEVAASSVLYTGDDDIRDRQFAINSGADFVLIPKDPEGQRQAWREAAAILQLTTAIEYGGING